MIYLGATRQLLPMRTCPLERPTTNLRCGGGSQLSTPADPDAQFIACFDETSEFDPTHPKYASYRSFNLSAVDRGRLIVKRLAKKARIDGAQALDIGAGSGGIAIALAEAGASVDAVEPDPVRFRWATERIAGHGVPVRLSSSSGESLPFDAATFDLVILDSVIEHVENPRRVIREVARVLRPGGIAYLVSPNKLSAFNILRDPHYEMFGVVLLPHLLGKLYVERVRRVDRGYWVYLIPTKRWLVSNLAREGLRAEQMVPDSFEKLTAPGAPFRGPRPVRLVARAAVRLGMASILQKVALAQYPTFIFLGEKDEAGQRAACDEVHTRSSSESR